MSNGGGSPDFACHCLNPNSAGEYQPLFVGEDGISIAHNELTLRTRSAISTDAASRTGHTQHTLVTCLVCETTAYRVKTEVTPDAEAKEGPVLPTEDWAERDTLTSKTGWVDVCVGKGGCISGEEAKRVASSSSYSPHFSIMLLGYPRTSTSSPLPQTRFSIPNSHSFLPSLPPFLPPPPFTPSHPIFLHLSAIATAASNTARSATGSRITEFTKRQLEQLEEEESRLKAQLEHLWRNVREGLKKVEMERDADLFPSLHQSRRSMSPRSCCSSGMEGIGSPVVRSFVPSTYHGPKASASSAARQSALSASLAATSFHHPRARQGEINGQSNDGESAPQPLTPSPPPYVSNPSSPRNSSEWRSSGSDSVVNLSRSLKRNMDAANDIAVTYRWYVIEEQEAARRKAREDVKKEREQGKNDSARGAPEAGRTDEPAHVQQLPTARISQAKGETNALAGKGKDSPRKGDGKRGAGRKVMFDTEPDIITIKRDINAEKEEEYIPENGEDLIFDFEDSDVEVNDQSNNGEKRGDFLSKDSPQPVLPLYEAPEQQQKLSRRSDDLKNAGLPQSFSALRPSSLPAPSNVRPPLRSQTDEKKSFTPAFASNGPSPRNLTDGRRRAYPESSSNGTLLPHEKELLKLVAADTPSHRGAWSRDSNAWRIFDRSGMRSALGTSPQTIVEEEESEPLRKPVTSSTSNAKVKVNWREYRLTDIASSLPVPMAPVSQLKASGAPSLHPKTSVTDRQGVFVPPLPTVVEEAENGKKKSAVANRREAYAERDRVRAMDPGILDFVRDDDGEEEENNTEHEHEEEPSQVSTSRGRQHALKIIKARNAVPAEGLWRSLAT